ncbi:hypothetical protein [Candidatus Nitrotoga arctica]|uniref:Uncharacterized protein n=1 Tax=Candidatus Nitrotoga arctica TaxID=453162 RepID=A0ABN8AK84_9PROT|nr:hypothetical protein [Candidatus Nitrotoga arctica]CAG9932024.1 conserved protein of unknown function [Candidatus Nitrotoga arctica]
MEIPGISTLSTILKRPIELRNDALAQRRELAAELQENCQKLALFLKNAFRIAKQVNEVDSEASEKKIMNLIDDLKHMDSTFMEEESPVLQHLAIDMRFKDFAKSCADFYQSALNLKQLLNENIPDSIALKALCKEEGLLKVTGAWQGELETMLARVNQEYMKVMAIKFSW